MVWTHDATDDQIVAGEHGRGNGTSRLNEPINVVVDRKRNHVFINDLKNRRVVRWACQNGTSGDIIISNIHCRGLAIDNDGYLYVLDCDKNEVRRWKIGETSGTLIAGGDGEGDRLNPLCRPVNLVVDDNQSLYILDRGNNRVIKWMKGAKEGIIVADGENGPTEWSCPHGLVVDHLGTVYVANCSAHRILRW